MKKMAPFLISLCLFSCSTLDNDYRAANVGSKIQQIDKKLPAYDLPTQLNYLDKTYYQDSISTKNRTSNPNDKRTIIYKLNQQTNQKNEEFLMITDNIVANQSDAYLIFLRQIITRSPMIKILKQGNAYYAISVDKRNGFNYLVVGTYNKLNYLARNRFYYVKPNDKSDRLIRNMLDNAPTMVEGLLNLDK